MNTSKLKTFAQNARRRLMEQVAVRVEAALNMSGAEAAENKRAIEELKKAIFETSREAVIERVAYIWFNRLSALRFMDANNYTLIRTVSPAEGFTQPEILAQAKQGIIPDELLEMSKGQQLRQRVMDLLSGTLPSRDGQGEAYRLLLVAVCNYYYDAMPFMFEKIDDYSELLLPTDLLSEDSVLSKTVAAMDAEACEEVEVIGWLYQFYISEKKDEVFASKKKVSAENIPAATQLFTPNWIVRYLVENSLGRLWMLNNPDSRLKEKMDYYIEPEQQEEDFLRVSSPEELRICDPAVGSGHMLVYAFDLLYAIYEERGYQPSSIPDLILEHNLYGIEIDERAGALAAFALTMKARQKSRRFFRKPTQPNICVMENVSFKRDALNDYVNAVGKDLFTFDLGVTLDQFANAKHFGSLIRPELKDVRTVLDSLRERDDLRDDMFYGRIHNDVMKLLEMVDYLSGKYHVVVANPPYMGLRKANSEFRDFSKSEYKKSKIDLFSMFIERSLDLANKSGIIAMITMQSWMFLSSFQQLRRLLLNRTTFLTMAHMGANAFDTISGDIVQTTAFTSKNTKDVDFSGTFIRLVDGRSELDKQNLFKNRESISYNAKIADFNKIPSYPIAYWTTNSLRNVFNNSQPLASIGESIQGMITGNNDRFLRLWFEISCNSMVLNASEMSEVNLSYNYWIPYNKGGGFQKWYGNNDYVINWSDEGRELTRARTTNKHLYLQPCITWTFTSSASFSARWCPNGFLWDLNGSSLFLNEYETRYVVLGLMCSVVGKELLRIINPTLSFQVENILAIPFHNNLIEVLEGRELATQKLIANAKSDWDSYETSWDFTNLPLLRSEHRGATLAKTYGNLREAWREMTLEMQRLEEENNRIFIEAYGLQDELTPDVPLSEITLTCNPHYRYDSKSSEEKLEARLLEDTMKEFISYAVGCMFGRYALEKEGLILANQGETRADYDRKVPNSSFPADEDNVIPILTENWFEDDIVERFGAFLRLIFGAEKYEENLRFIEEAIGSSIRDYFLRESRSRNISDFYEDHVSRYNKRPIYWLFASENNAFCAMIYMHRYQPDTASVILNEYLREYRSKLEARVVFLEGQTTSASVSSADKTQALKDIEKYKAIIKELNEYERDVLYPLATEQRPMDLDDGVAVNYEAFGTALYEVRGLNK